MGKDVIICIIINSGFSFFKILIKGKIENNTIIKYEILLFKNPFFGRNRKNLNLKLITSILFFSNNSRYSSHSHSY